MEIILKLPLEGLLASLAQLHKKGLEKLYNKTLISSGHLVLQKTEQNYTSFTMNTPNYFHLMILKEHLKS